MFNTFFYYDIITKDSEANMEIVDIINLYKELNLKIEKLWRSL